MRSDRRSVNPVVLTLTLGLSASLGIAGCKATAPQESMRVKATPAGTASIDFAGYRDCPVLFNEHTRVVLGPHCGGRVLEYAWQGKNALYLNPKQNGWVPEPDARHVQPCAGRFDIAPERQVAPHFRLWAGPWTAEFIGPRSARMTSPIDRGVGLRLVREFTLAPNSSQLRCTQTMINMARKTQTYCYWGRSFSPGGGTCVVPLTLPSRFPGKYMMIMPHNQVAVNPKDPNVEVGKHFVLVKGPPQRAEIAFDSFAGWFAYHHDDLLFIKKFPVYRDRVYNMMIPITVCFYYGKTICELEPFGPAQTLEPGASASFTVDWWLVPHSSNKGTDPETVKRLAERCFRGSRADK